MGEIVALLEGGTSLTRCAQEPDTCERVDNCVTRYLWVEAANAIFERLSRITFADLVALEKKECKNQFLDYLGSQERTADDESGT